MDRGVQSESIQYNIVQGCLTTEYWVTKFGHSEGHQFFSVTYNRVGSKDLSFVDTETLFPIDFRWGFGHTCTEYAKFGRSEGHQFFSTNG